MALEPIVTCWKTVQFLPMTAPLEMKTPLRPCGRVRHPSICAVSGMDAPFA